MRHLRERGLTAGVCLAVALFAGSQVLAQAEAPAATPAPADAGMDAFFIGTLQIVAAAKYHEVRQFSADHTYVDKEGRKLFHGTWAIKDGKICTSREGVTVSYCNVGVGRQIGDSWADKDPYTGNEVDFTLVAERKPLN